MSSLPPLMVYSTRVAPKGVIDYFKTTRCPLEIEGPEDDWSKITVTVSKKGLFRSARTLIINHSSEYYDGNEWFRQRLGLGNYLAAFPETPFKADILRLVSSFQFAISISRDNWDATNNGDRLKQVYGLCRYLDAVLFSPTALYDSEGRILCSRDGKFDPQAKLPQIPVFLSAPEELEDDESIEPPTAQRVAKRALILVILASRAFLETDTPQNETGEDERTYLLDLIRKLKLEDELEPQEWKVLQRPVRRLEQQDYINAVWRIEGAVTLAWALGRFPLPSDDELVDVQSFYDELNISAPDELAQRIETAILRSTDELKEMQIHLTMLHWRVRNYRLRPGQMDFAKFSENCWIGSFDISKFRLIENDLAIGNVAIHNADQEELSRVTSLAMERHLAINWCLGESRLYSDTDTST